MKIAVIGTGYVGQAYLRAIHFLGYHPLALSRSWINYYDPSILRHCLSVYKPELVINCAGYTGETVDDCRDNVEECKQANMILPGIIAEICEAIKARMIHISSGCIFNGNGNFAEESPPNFIENVYQMSKLFGEHRVSIGCESHWIFRIRMPFNHLPHPRNWLMKLRKYQRILDGLNSVTFLDQFCIRSLHLATGGVAGKDAPPGIYHACESRPLWTMDVAHVLHDAGLRQSPRGYDPKEFVKRHTQRSSTVLDSSKFERAYGTPFGDAHCAIRWCIEQMKTSPGNAQRCHGGQCKTESPSSDQISLQRMSRNIAGRDLDGRPRTESDLQMPHKDGKVS